MGVGMDELSRTGDQSIEAAVAAKRGTEESYASGPPGLDLMRHDDIVVGMAGLIVIR
jgi:hypothetical protein